MTTTITTTITTPATDDQIRAWLQEEIKASLQGNGLDWLDLPITLAVEETLEQQEAPDTDYAETMTAAARHHIARASRAAAEGDWSNVAEYIRLLEVELSCVLGAPGRQARSLQDQLDTVKAAVEAAQLEPGSPEWIAWTGPEYCKLLLDQPWYSGLQEALNAWENCEALTINGDRLEIIEPETE